jgi:hypothetical protein
VALGLLTLTQDLDLGRELAPLGVFLEEDVSTAPA